MTTTTPSKYLVFLALVTIQVLFGINYVVSKLLVDSFPPLLWASARVFISALLMLLIALVLRRPHPKPDKKFFLPLIVFAILGTVINQGCFLTGLRYTSSTNSAILNTLIPVFTLLIVTIRRIEPLSSKRMLGFIFSFIGVLVLRKVETLSFSDQTLLGDLLIVLNCLSYGLFLSYSKHFFSSYDRVWGTTWLFLYGSIGLGLLAAPEWAHFHMPTLTNAMIASMLFVTLGATLTAYFLNIWTLTYSKSSSVAIFIYLQPIVSASISYFFLGESVSLRTAISSIIIFIGVLLVILPAKTQVKN